MSDASTDVRLDRWLWAARFFRTRQLAVDAVRGGKVSVNGVRAKPARAIRVGDRLEIVRAGERFTVDVRAVSDKRGPAPVARELYAETAQSAAERERIAEQNRVAATAVRHAPGRPTKRDRRRLRTFLREE